MDWTRREILKACGIGGALTAVSDKTAPAAPRGPVVVSTWKHGVAANEAAVRNLRGGGSALDAVEAGVRVSEADPEVHSVGRGGHPNEDGVVQLDAAIMDGRTHRAGSVAALERTLHPVSVARRVMETTRHVLLVGEGALLFARRNGFPEADLLTDDARKRWLDWKRNLSDRDFWIDDHDTIGMVAMDAGGGLAASCTTSGLAWKLPGRVGDSPLIGHGLYADQEAGAAAATGVGEAVIRNCGSFHVVERMRAGDDPARACRSVLERIRRKEPDLAGQVAFVALRADGLAAGAGLRPGFQYALARRGANDLLDAPSLKERS
jgi:isoaspartyl peptidase/L-asparaginase-like protein (Ntn-hydrolase superfamily)